MCWLRRPVDAPDYLESGLIFGHSPEEGFKADGIMKVLGGHLL